jgi:hypothetical protein
MAARIRFGSRSRAACALDGKGARRCLDERAGAFGRFSTK